MAKTQKFPHSPYINAISAIETTHMAQKSTDIGGEGNFDDFGVFCHIFWPGLSEN